MDSLLNNNRCKTSHHKENDVLAPINDHKSSKHDIIKHQTGFKKDSEYHEEILSSLCINISEKVQRCISIYKVSTFYEEQINSMITEFQHHNVRYKIKSQQIKFIKDVLGKMNNFINSIENDSDRFAAQIELGLIVVDSSYCLMWTSKFQKIFGRKATVNSLLSLAGLTLIKDNAITENVKNLFFYNEQMAYLKRYWSLRQCKGIFSNENETIMKPLTQTPNSDIESLEWMFDPLEDLENTPFIDLSLC